jgi:hypothetical protein
MAKNAMEVATNELERRMKRVEDTIKDFQEGIAKGEIYRTIRYKVNDVLTAECLQKQYTEIKESWDKDGVDAERLKLYRERVIRVLIHNQPFTNSEEILRVPYSAALSEIIDFYDILIPVFENE